MQDWTADKQNKTESPSMNTNAQKNVLKPIQGKKGSLSDKWYWGSQQKNK